MAASLQSAQHTCNTASIETPKQVCTMQPVLMLGNQQA